MYYRLTYFGSVVGSAEDELRSTVVARANVRDIWFVLHQNFCASEIAQLQDAAVGVEKKILGLDVTVADALRVDVRQSSEELVNIEFDFEDGHRRLHFVEESGGSVNSLGDKLLDEIEIHFILLESRQRLSGIMG